jgi:hypothetical protein
MSAFSLTWFLHGRNSYFELKTSASENMVNFIHDTVFLKKKMQHIQFLCGLFTEMLNLMSGVGFNTVTLVVESVY